MTMTSWPGMQDPALTSAPCTTQSGGTLAPSAGVSSLPGTVAFGLQMHAPFTLLSTLSGICIMAVFVLAQVPREVSVSFFWTLHPLHVFLSALVTTAMYTLRRPHGLAATIALGYAGAVGIATLSDCIIPFLGEVLLGLPNRGIHLGFIERPCPVNMLATAGIFAGVLWPRTRLPHAGHVLVSTWASLFHILMAIGGDLSTAQYLLIAIFLFFAVWIPCCASDIVFPLIFAQSQGRTAAINRHKPLADNRFLGPVDKAG